MVCSSPVTRDVKSLLAYPLIICISLEKFLFVSLACFLSFLFRVLYVIPPVIPWEFFIRTRVLYIMCLLILYGDWAWNYSVLSRRLPLHPMMFPFVVRNSLVPSGPSRFFRFCGLCS